MKRKIVTLLLCSCMIFPAAQIHAEEDLQQEYSDLLEQFQELEEAFAEFQEHYNQVYGEPETESIRTDSEMGTLNDWEIEVSSIEFCDEIIADYGSYTANDGSLYAVVSLTVTNTGTTSDTFLPSFAYGDDVIAKICIGEYEYSATYLASYSEDLHDTALNPLLSASGIIAFSVPESIIDESDVKIVFTSGESNLEMEL